MKALQASEKHLTLIRLCAGTTNNASNIGIKEILPAILIILFLSVTAILPSVRFICHNLHDFLSCTFAGMIFVGFFSMIISTVTITFQNKQIRTIIDVIRRVTQKGIDMKLWRFCKTFKKNYISFSFFISINRRRSKNCRTIQIQWIDRWIYYQESNHLILNRFLITRNSFWRRIDSVL